MKILYELLSDSYFVLFLIIALSYIIGRIKIHGFSLGVSAVIFVALVFGHYGVVLPKVVQDIGLVLFVFTIGIQSGPGFFDALKKDGIKLASLSAVLVFTAGLIAVLCSYIFDLQMPIIAGLFVGALTSAPGLAAATDQFGEISSIGYGIAYPFGVIGVILFLRSLPKLMRSNIRHAEKDYEKEITAEYPAMQPKTILVTNANVDNKSIAQLQFRSMTEAVISRVMHEQKVSVPKPATKLHMGDLVRVVGTQDAIDRATLILGEVTDEEFPVSGKFDVHGVLVTNKTLVNKSIAEINLQANYDATITRIRRSGIDITPTPDARIRFGDKLIVASQTDQFEQINRLFGNDDKRLSDTDVLPIALGIVLGVIVGAFTPLGLTGGVLCVALILSKIGKTGPILWTMSSAANILLREFGLILFLAVIGTSAGATLVSTYMEYGYKLFLIGGLITILPMVLAALAAKYFYKLNILSVLGALAGGMTSTPGLAAVAPMTRSNAPQIAYATAYPIAMVLIVFVVKILGWIG